MLSNFDERFRRIEWTKKAIETYKQWIDSCVRDPVSWYYLLGAAFAHPWNGLAGVYRILGRQQDAVDTYQAVIKIDPKDVSPHTGLAGIYQHLGHKAEAAQHMIVARQLVAPDDHYSRACLEAIAGNVNSAIEHLVHAVEQHPGQRTWARHDPDLAALHGDQRFEELVATDEQRING